MHILSFSGFRYFFLLAWSLDIVDWEPNYRAVIVAFLFDALNRPKVGVFYPTRLHVSATSKLPKLATGV